VTSDAVTSPLGTSSVETGPVGASAPEQPDGEPRRRRGRPKGSTSARPTRTIELILTVSGTADGEWQAELKQGSTWLTRGLPVTAAAVSRAARELHAELSGPIDAEIGSAREQRAARVATALEAEQARTALAATEVAAMDVTEPTVAATIVTVP